MSGFIKKLTIVKFFQNIFYRFIEFRPMTNSFVSKRLHFDDCFSNDSIQNSFCMPFDRYSICVLYDEPLIHISFYTDIWLKLTKPTVQLCFQSVIVGTFSQRYEK